MSIASVDEISDFLCRFGVNDAAKLRRAAGGIAKHPSRVCNYAHLDSAHTRMAGDNLFRVIGLKLVQVSFVQQTIQKLAHVVRLAMIFRNYFRNPFRLSARIRSARILAGGPQASSLPIHWQLRNKLSYFRNRLFIILNSIMGHSRKLIMRTRPAECFVINRLTRRAFHQIRATQAHERSAFDHDHDVRQRRQVRAAGDTRPHHCRNLWDSQIAPHD